MDDIELVLSILNNLLTVNNEAINLLGGKKHANSFLLGQNFALENAIREISENI